MRSNAAKSLTKRVGKWSQQKQVSPLTELPASSGRRLRQVGGLRREDLDGSRSAHAALFLCRQPGLHIMMRTGPVSNLGLAWGAVS